MQEDEILREERMSHFVQFLRFRVDFNPSNFQSCWCLTEEVPASKAQGFPVKSDFEG